MDIELFRWAMSDAVLDLVEPIIGSDIALFSTHFICKPKGDGKRLPWQAPASVPIGAILGKNSSLSPQLPPQKAPRQVKMKCSKGIEHF